ncbi:hypothetical protein LPW41_03365 [Microbacterium sp. JC 701]|uniref:hypothetical protein n=1 Tax=Microbacterium sp. JC 701 TaxID=2897389 RepID=UPI001E32D35E|nr:hypothetical protein [Microbacterium sp. JC 701]MCD2168730.1 hypothetical protein [Microbacterium sp. JC 701]
MGVVVAIGGGAVTAFVDDDDLVGRLQIPAGVYGPVMIIAGLAIAAYGTAIVVRARRS